MLPTSTARDRGTSERNASQRRNSAANAETPIQTQTSASIAFQCRVLSQSRRMGSGSFSMTSIAAIKAAATFIAK